jgi:chorismate mutase
MANTANLEDVESALDLNNIRNSLQRMEDSIIFSLIERAQYPSNAAVYQEDCRQLGEFKLHQLKSAGSNGCLGDWFIYQTECLHSQVRRYLHPTEYPFFGPLPDPTLGTTAEFVKTDGDEPAPKRQRAERHNVLAPVPPEALINGRLLDIYRGQIIPRICEAGDDGNHGSCAVQDVHVLQTMATRIYYGLFVAESKYRSEIEKASALIRANDRSGLMAFITKPEVEERNLQRVVLKARTFSQDISRGEAGQLVPSTSDVTTYKLDPEYVGQVFRDFLMPLTKDVEVDYLLNRIPPVVNGKPAE